ncbi:MAG: decarboxylating NADP(+)-dependent phosphogluconate dehydrogenase [Tenericutes bacterium]|nr:decarboxylating NADP(+)-dependent phosphogluconate dehydrogenase [Mycoplasmatota bacterium]
MKKQDIGMIGLAVMGENLVLNMESKGFSVAGYDIDTNRVNNFKNNRAKNKNIELASSLEEFVSMLKKPRKVMMMIRAGSPVDQVIESLLPLLEKGDIIIDGGNSQYTDTMRRMKYVEEHGLLFIGAGVSGGEEGALNGPSIMPGGSYAAWKHMEPIFKAIAARTINGDICADWIGSDGAGHYVKMVHNGIEYGDMQLITEVYHIMRNVLNMLPDEMSQVFKEWNNNELNSYLIEITAEILAKKDEFGNHVVDYILDTAGQKGTGKWTAISSLEEGIPLSVIGEAVYSRCLSSQKEERVHAEIVYPKTKIEFAGNKQAVLDELKDALFVARILSYAQGFVLLREASKANNWKLNFGSIALLWRGGCIIRSAFLDDINTAFKTNPSLANLILDSHFEKVIKSRINNYRKAVSLAILNGIPVPALSAGLSYFDGYTTGSLPANLLQAQRDFFGAHTYERTDKARGEFFHTNWTGLGGTTSSTTYNV